MKRTRIEQFYWFSCEVPPKDGLLGVIGQPGVKVAIGQLKKAGIPVVQTGTQFAPSVDHVLPCPLEHRVVAGGRAVGQLQILDKRLIHFIQLGINQAFGFNDLSGQPREPISFLGEFVDHGDVLIKPRVGVWGPLRCWQPVLHFDAGQGIARQTVAPQFPDSGIKSVVIGLVGARCDAAAITLEKFGGANITEPQFVKDEDVLVQLAAPVLQFVLLVGSYLDVNHRVDGEIGDEVRGIAEEPSEAFLGVREPEI